MDMNRKVGHLEKMDVNELTEGIKDDWNNFVVSEVNDHVARLSVLQRDFHWHLHKNSDELFYVIEGKLFVDLEDRIEEIGPGQMITIPKNVRHRTRANSRTIILCFESASNVITGDM
jgi:mannose-6-phosphate isomerase-like protein (cupin superfamily)